MGDYHRTFAILSASLLLSPTPNALAEDPDSAVLVDEDSIEEIVVTGSRIKRSTYTSIAPLQILTSDSSRQFGLIDTAAVLQESSPASGMQVDLTMQGFVTANGPGASTISLRGLGQERTLVLINGRRLAPAGVEGAPTAADLNLVPSAFVRQYDLLLDGASSVYGSDAIAGVTNIILRNDFDGLEVGAWHNMPRLSGGQETTLSAAWGTEWSSGYFGIGVEHERNEPVLLGQRDWSSGCTRHVEVGEDGNIRYDNLYDVVNWGMAPTPCRTNVAAGWVWVDDLRGYVGGFDSGPGSIFYTPGRSNTGIPNFSDYRNAFLTGGIDADGDGVTDVQRVDAALSQADGLQHMYPEFERTSAMAYGELELNEQLSVFFEIQYGRRVTQSVAKPIQFFPSVPPGNPYNICNPSGVDGVDCALAWNEHYNQQAIIDMFVSQYGIPPQAGGLGLNPPAGAMGVRPVVAVDGDRNIIDANVTQTRAVLGLRGDLPGLDLGPIGNAEFELSFVGARSIGESHINGIREDWLNESLSTSTIDPATGSVVCGIDATGDGVPDGVNADGRRCVPVNLFAQTLFDGLVGDFASAEERDYLFDSRDFYTRYEQWLVSASLTADLFEMPGGTAAGVVGFEFRNDEINSIPDDVARDGLFFSFFSDGGAVGEKFTREYFAEIELPLLSDTRIADELTVNLSGRHTTDEFFGSETTYAARVGWRPVDTFLIRATKGTSFRAPNLGENFIKPSFDEAWVFDPCAVPEEAIDPLNGYDPTMDSREEHVLQNCRDQGVDPTALNLGGDNFYPVPGQQGGTADLEAERSDSYSYGFVWSPSVGEAELSLGWTYYSIEVDDSIIFPRAQAIVNDCYATTTRDSVLCSRITRDPSSGQMTYLVRDFINRDRLKASGHDINMHIGVTPVVTGREIDLTVDLVLHHPSEVSELFTDDFGNVDFEDYVGRWAHPDWKGTLALRAGLSDWQLTWRVAYIDAVSSDPELLDEWGDVDSGSHTCLGPAEGDVLCRNVGFADNYITHSASLYYAGESWMIGGGIRNVFDEDPPIVDPSEVWASAHNVPLAVGYDLNGRMYFFNVQMRFGG